SGNINECESIDRPIRLHILPYRRSIGGVFRKHPRVKILGSKQRAIPADAGLRTAVWTARVSRHQQLRPPGHPLALSAKIGCLDVVCHGLSFEANPSPALARSLGPRKHNQRPRPSFLGTAAASMSAASIPQYSAIWRNLYRSKR